MFSLFRDFFSHKALFIDLFVRDANNLVEMSQLLEQVMGTDDSTTREGLYKQINTLESTGDDITHKIYLALDKVFFTPLNRKDIHSLASVLDDVADYIDEVSGRLQLYRPDGDLPAFKDLTNILARACAIINELVSKLMNITSIETMLQQCKQIKQLEREADKVYYQALADLFAYEKDAIELIKYRDILHSLETSVNRCKSVTDAIELILINSI